MPEISQESVLFSRINSLKKEIRVTSKNYQQLDSSFSCNLKDTRGLLELNLKLENFKKELENIKQKPTDNIVVLNNNQNSKSLEDINQDLQNFKKMVLKSKNSSNELVVVGATKDSQVQPNNLEDVDYMSLEVVTQEVGESSYEPQIELQNELYLTPSEQKGLKGLLSLELQTAEIEPTKKFGLKFGERNRNSDFKVRLDYSNMELNKKQIRMFEKSMTAFEKKNLSLEEQEARLRLFLLREKALDEKGKKIKQEQRRLTRVKEYDEFIIRQNESHIVGFRRKG